MISLFLWLLAAGTAAAIFVFRAWVHTTAGRMQWESLVLKFPIAGKIVRKAAMGQEI